MHSPLMFRTDPDPSNLRVIFFKKTIFISHPLHNYRVIWSFFREDMELPHEPYQETKILDCFKSDILSHLNFVLQKKCFRIFAEHEAKQYAWWEHSEFWVVSRHFRRLADLTKNSNNHDMKILAVLLLKFAEFWEISISSVGILSSPILSLLRCIAWRPMF